MKYVLALFTSRAVMKERAFLGRLYAERCRKLFWFWRGFKMDYMFFRELFQQMLLLLLFCFCCFFFALLLLLLIVCFCCASSFAAVLLLLCFFCMAIAFTAFAACLLFVFGLLVFALVFAVFISVDSVCFLFLWLPCCFSALVALLIFVAVWSTVLHSLLFGLHYCAT